VERTEVELAVRERVAARIEAAPESLDPAADLVDDLGADSLVLVELAADLEDAFDVRLIEDAGALRTVEAWVDAVLLRSR
jgi:acyl carrier protein